MEKISSRYLNINTLSEITEVIGYDSVLLVTPVGNIIGTLHFPSGEETDTTLCNLIAKTKTNICDASESEIELIGDGSMVCVKDAIILQANNQRININEITVHCGDIVAFSPVNRDEFLSQLR